MARPAQYSPARRIVMQITMVFVLFATLGLAMVVARARERATAVVLHDKPHLTPYLAMRLPRGWPVLEQDADELPMRVTAMTSKDADLHADRVLTIYQVGVTKGASEDLLRHALEKVPGSLSGVRPFSILGQPGVLGRFETLHAVPDDPRQRSYEVPGWYAAAVIPGGGPEGAGLGVVISVEGYSTAGPAGSRLVRQLADGLSLRRP